MHLTAQLSSASPIRKCERVDCLQYCHALFLRLIYPVSVSQAIRDILGKAVYSKFNLNFDEKLLYKKGGIGLMNSLESLMGKHNNPEKSAQNLLCSGSIYRDAYTSLRVRTI
ncbi:unnamed protein product [Periconia digitata]|uniref:Uncharacterized protein n=1 Tax=Periconia digitata TaxID=1303443 RepID=A0A9W4XLE7_9PLEO|nr:unnamed protein product [Periconia digitata]